MIKRKEYLKILEENVEMKKEINEMKNKIVELNNKYEKEMDSFSEAMDLNEWTEKKIIKIENEKQNLITNIKNLTEKTKELEKNKDILLKRNFAIKEILGKEYSDWQIEAGLAWRFSFNKNKPEKYKVPKNLKIGKIEDFDFDDNFIMCQFKHSDKEERSIDYEIPCSLYTSLGGKLFEKNNEITGYYDLMNIDNIDDLKIALTSNGNNLSGKYIEKFLQFIIDYKGKTFSGKEFSNYCQFKNRESKRQYLNKLKKWGLIRQIDKSLYKFNSNKT